MALFDVDVDVTGLEQQLKKLERRGGDLSPTMAIVAEMLVAGVSDEFETEGRGRWPGLADSTLRSRRGSTAKILQDSGIFAGSIEPTSGPTWAEAGTGVDYAIHHVYGAPGANIPQRNPFDIDDAIFDDAIRLILARITR